MTADLTLTGRTPCSAQCENCTTSISAAFRPCMLHHYSDILGYLDLQNTTAVDLVLQECELTVGCLSCSQEGPMQVTKHVMLNIPEQLRCEISCNRKQMFFFHQNLSYGQTKEFNCENCHTKLSILAESTKFHYIQPRTNKTGQSSSTYDIITI